MTTPREERLAAALKDIAAMECVYGDGCNPIPLGGVPDKLCAVCRAREALESPLPPEETDRAPRLPDAIGEAIHAFAEAHRAAEAVGEHASIADQRAAIVATDDAYCNLVEAIRAALASYRSSRPVKGG